MNLALERWLVMVLLGDLRNCLCRSVDLEEAVDNVEGMDKDKDGAVSWGEYLKDVYSYDEAEFKELERQKENKENKDFFEVRLCFSHAPLPNPYPGPDLDPYPYP